MKATRQDRLDEFLRRLRCAAPFSSRDVAFEAVANTLRDVENELSEIPEDPNAAFAPKSDGRMYPPHERFRVQSGSKRLEAYRQKAHRTVFADNGALRIEELSGRAVLDLSGLDGKTVTDIMEEGDE